MSHDRKAGDLCAVQGLPCHSPDCVKMSQCMFGFGYRIDTDGALGGPPPLPSDSARRKASPVYSGVLAYFPDALLAVARVSKAGNDKHNPGQPLHWSREKSNDHLDCAARHMLTPFEIDPDSKEIHLANAVWRLLAELQIYQETQSG